MAVAGEHLFSDCSASRQIRRLQGSVAACTRQRRAPQKRGFRKRCRSNKLTQQAVHRDLPSQCSITNLGPFGEVIRATGPMAKANPFRFSTKYQDDESDLVYYGYRFYNASTGRWVNRDPLEEYAGFNIYCFVIDCPLSFIDLFGLGHWNVNKKDIDVNQPGIKEGANPQGFEVIYVPDPGECSDGTIVVFQIVSSVGLGGQTAHVDGTSYSTSQERAQATGCPAPPQMKPVGSTPYSYLDSPDGDAVYKHKLTAVAVCRNSCKDKVLSTYYFEWDDKKRDFIPKTDPNYKTHFNDGKKRWYGGAGSN